MISFPCPLCDKPLRVKDELAGKKAKCPACGKPITVPAASESLAGAASESGKRSPAPGPVNEVERTKARPEAVADANTLPPIAPVGVQPPADSSGSETVGGGPKEGVNKYPTELTDFLAPPQAPDEIGRLGHYRVLKVLGQGGMGVVFQAEEPALKRKVALKAMLPTLAVSETAKQRFLREAQSAAAIEHDNIVPIFFVGEDRGVPFLAMPFLKGEPLDERLNREKFLPITEVLRIGREAAKGLGAAHAAGLVHRDIKPANLWLEGEEGRVKILDFGLARAAADNAQLTQQGAIIGTPAYMAPEQGAGKPVDARCDLFSLGCVLYRACTGEPPFKGTDTVSTLVAVAMDNPPPPVELRPELPGALSDLVMQLLAKKPEERPESAKIVAETLQEIEGQGGAIPAPLVRKTGKVKGSGTARMEATRSYPGRSAKRRPRLPWLVGGGVVGLSVVGLLLFFLLRPSDKQASGERKVVPDGNKPVATQPEALPPTFKNSLGMEFVLVPKGKSWLGGGTGQPGDPPGDKKVEIKEVEIKEDFYLGKYEVTQEEWQEVTGQNPSAFNAVAGVSLEDQKRFPVENVSWDDVQLFLGQLNKRDKQERWIYRLPTELEWEYACRGGPLSDKLDSAFDFYFDKPVAQLQPEQANFEHGKGLKRTCKVGSYKPNRLGLYDMHGNVCEWCDDLLDPKDPARASHRAFRGGCWYDVSGNCRAAIRYAFTPSIRNRALGLRLARVPVGKEPVATRPPSEKKTETPPLAFKNNLGMEFVLVPKGKSWLGGGGGNPGDREVEIKEDFYLGKYEVTQEEWEKLMASNPSAFKSIPGVGQQDQKRIPVDNVTWDETQAFIEQLNKRTAESGWVYRLPKEAEWEYACRGGPLADKADSACDYYFDKPTSTLLPEQANFKHDKGQPEPRKVGSYKPNRLGLYDMHGNVWEWCDDADKETPNRVVRGGGWNYNAWGSRAAHRATSPPTRRSKGMGLRLARVPVAADDKGWVQLFNGKDLKGWKEYPNGTEHWKVENGVLIGTGDLNTLFSDRGDYENFHWRIETRHTGMAGKIWRAQFADPASDGYYFELNPQIGGLGKLTLKNRYSNPLAQGKAPTEPSNWRTEEIITVGPHITIKVNGQTVLETEDKTFLKGHLALRPNSAGAVIEIRKIEIKELPSQTLKNSLGMEFVLVPKGKSWLGGGGGKPGDKEVEIKEDFYLGKYEVTQEEWGKVMGAMPSHFSRTSPAKDAVKDISDAELKRFPVEMVSWDDAQLFLKELNKRDRQEGWVYRLPKEVEWEYACRGGPMSDKLDSAFDYYFDKPMGQLQPDQANSAPEPGKGLQRTCKVGSYKPNKLGLYDMHGNVWEWCDDEQKLDKGASHRVARGGSWFIVSGFCGAATRHANVPSARSHNIGLRLARVPVGKDPK